MILTGAPRSVAGNAMTEPRVFPTASQRRHPRDVFQSRARVAPQPGRDLGELGELVVIARVVRLDVAQVDHRRAERRQFRDVGVIADPGVSAPDELRSPQRPVVFRQDDKERLAGLSEPAHLRFEDIDIDVRRSQDDQSELARIRRGARDLDLPQRLDRHPIAERMGNDSDMIGVARQGKPNDMLKAVARRRRAVGVVDVIGELPGGGKGEKHRNAVSL